MLFFYKTRLFLEIFEHETLKIIENNISLFSCFSCSYYSAYYRVCINYVST